MATGNFRLYYLADNGQQRPAAKVRYRILQLPDRNEVVNGTTDAQGLTKFVNTTPNPLQNPLDKGSNLPRRFRSFRPQQYDSSWKSGTSTSASGRNRISPAARRRRFRTISSSSSTAPS